VKQTRPKGSRHPGRIPSLILEDGEVIIDSAAILDWIDEHVGPSRALIPRSGFERRRALRLIALATGTIDKTVTSAYERIIRPPQWRWQDWIARCRKQAEGGIEALAAEEWPATATLDQAQMTTARMIRYVQLADLDLLPPGRYPSLDSLAQRCEAMPEFQATCPPDLPYPQGLPPVTG
jgi:glutathione S-transferase